LADSTRCIDRIAGLLNVIYKHSNWEAGYDLAIMCLASVKADDVKGKVFDLFKEKNPKTYLVKKGLIPRLSCVDKYGKGLQLLRASLNLEQGTCNEGGQQNRTGLWKLVYTATGYSEVKSPGWILKEIKIREAELQKREQQTQQQQSTTVNTRVSRSANFQYGNEHL